MSLSFEKCPISQFIFTSALASFLFTSIKDGTYSLDINCLYKGQIYKFFTSQLLFSSSPQIVIGSILIYSLRQFERQMGSRKFGAFILISYIISVFSQLAILIILSTLGINFAYTPGPFYYIYSLIPFYYFYIPKLNPVTYSSLGYSIIFSEKSWLYLLSLQLLLSDGMQTIVPGMCGVLSAYVYSIEGLKLQSFRIPSFIENIISRLGGGLLSFFPIGSNHNNRQLATGNQQGPGTGDALRDNARVQNNQHQDRINDFQQFPPPPEESIQSLIGLGFDRSAVIVALQASHNNVEAAANRLLSGY